MASNERAKVSRALGRVKRRFKFILGLAACTSALLMRPLSRYIRAMAEKFRCTLCDQEESRCQCDRYCFMCQGGHDVRLCQDGMYYCLECREACDMQAQN
jgi:hypothetical protein